MITPEAAQRSDSLARNYAFVFPERSLRGMHGELLGKNVGGAVEFHDHRPYYFGDDIRHIDWLVYGRSGSYVLKSYREDITPTTELIMDFSRSMGADPGKEDLSRSLGLFLLNVFSSNLINPVLWKCGSVPEKIRFDHRTALTDMSYDGRATLMNMLKSGYIQSKPNSMRIIVSDFLFPHSPASLIRRLSSQAAGVLVIQVLSKEDTDPEMRGGVLLEDCETREEFSLRVTQESVITYRERIGNISKGLESACRRHGAGFVRAHADEDMTAVLKNLVREGFLKQT